MHNAWRVCEQIYWMFASLESKVVWRRITFFRAVRDQIYISKKNLMRTEPHVVNNCYLNTDDDRLYS